MRLFEAIVEANHRAIAGDANAGVHIGEFEGELPIVALTCVDPRLNALLPNVLGVPADQFIWLRNAGNIITSSTSSTMRSLALACAVKGGKEIAIIGHTDCQVGKTTTMQLLEKFKALGVERHRLPENLTEFFGMFGTERQNVIKACDLARQSPLIGPKIFVHGLLVDVNTGKLEWLVNGYQNWESMSSKWNEVVKSADHTLDALKSLADFKIGEMKFPETKIGDTVTKAGDWLSEKIGKLEMKPPEPDQPPSLVGSAASVAQYLVETAEKKWPKPGAGAQPPKIPPPPPPPLRARPHVRRGGK
jgi:carbonic anhydrase